MTMKDSCSRRLVNTALVGLLAVLVAGGGGWLPRTMAAPDPAAVTVTTGQLYDRPVTILENGLIRLAVTPEIGGRVLAFERIGNGGSVANVRQDNIHLEPDDEWAGADYGGFTDAATSGWPGPFWGQPYELTVTEEPDGGRSIVVSAESEGIGIKRRMTMRPGSTEVWFTIRQKNLGDHPRTMTVRLHCEMAIGDNADNNDVLYVGSGQGQPESVQYVVGNEYERFRWMTVKEGWAAMVDAVEHEVVVRRFLPISEEHKLFWWAGFNESPELLGDKGAFYALDRFGREQTVPGGDIVTAEEAMFLVDGLPKVDFVFGDRAGSATLDRERYGNSDKLTLSVCLGGATALTGHEVSATVLSGTESLTTLTSQIESTTAGRAECVEMDWSFQDLPDGEYQVMVTVRDPALTVPAIGTIHQRFSIVGELVKNAASAIDAFEARIQGLKKAADKKIITERLDIATEFKVLALRKTQLEAMMTAGDYEGVLVLAESVEDEIAALTDRIAEANSQ